jgi:hypothetical protein
MRKLAMSRPGSGKKLPSYEPDIDYSYYSRKRNRVSENLMTLQSQEHYFSTPGLAEEPVSRAFSPKQNQKVKKSSSTRHMKPRLSGGKVQPKI